MVGIVACGAATTPYRPGGDEDAATLGVTAAQAALAQADFISRDQIGVAYFATLGRLLGQRPGASILREALELNPSCHVADLWAGGRSGSETLFAVENLIKPSAIRYGLAVVADDPQIGGTYGQAGAVALLLGRQQEEMIATVDFETGTRVAETLRDAIHTLTQAPPAARSVADAVVHLIREVWLRKRLKAADLRWVLLQEPYPDFRQHAAEVLGLTEQQVHPPDWSADVSPSSAVAPLAGLAAALEKLAPGQRVMIASAAADFGVDTFLFTATEHLAAVRNKSAASAGGEDSDA
jgi:3-hydroxy-3-methylglutaryl CoA synthase